MKRIFTLSTLFLLLIGNIAFAAPIDREQARKLAEDFLKTSVHHQKIRAAAPIHLNTINLSNDDEPEYYIFDINSKNGFIIIAGDDKVNSIAAYSPDKPFVANQIPPALQHWLDEYKRYVEDVRKGIISPVKVRESDNENTIIEPLVATKWDQNGPYNDICPIIENKRTMTGCAATAMAMLMKYHNWPKEGKGSAENKTSGETIDFSKSVYDWDNMLNEYTSSWDSITETNKPDYTDIEADAVAKLMVDCGYSIFMDYGTSVSGAQGSAIAGALVENFFYSPQIAYYPRECYTTAQWTEIIRNNLNQKLPILYAGSDGGQIGHIFVCDGIDANNYLHINWGWSGACDGYYDMNYMNPSETGIGGINGNYYRDQTILVNVRPITPEEEGMKVVQKLTIENDVYFMGNSRDSITRPLSSAYVNIQLGRLINYSGRPFKGSYCMGLFKDNELISIHNKMDVNMDIGGIKSTTITPRIPADTEPGNYELILLNKVEDTEEWSRTERGTRIDKIDLLIADGKATFTIKSNPKPDLSIVSLKVDEINYTGLVIYLDCTLKNNSSTMFKSALYVAAVPEDEVSENIRISNYRVGYLEDTAIYGDATVAIPFYQFRMGINKPGRHRLFLYYTNNLETVILPEDKEYYVEVTQTPNEPVVFMLTPLKLNTEELEQNSTIEMEVNSVLIGTKYANSKRVGLYVQKEGADATQEILLMEKDVRIYPTNQALTDFNDSITLPSSLTPGEYTAYLKYELEGDMVKMGYDIYNQAKIRVTEPTGIDNTTKSKFVIIQTESGLIIRGIEGSMQIALMDIAGKTIYNGVATDERGDYFIPLHNPSSGIYLITLKGEKDISTKKIFIK